MSIIYVVEHPYTISTNYFGGDTQCEQGETEEKNHPPALSATERERRKDNFQAFLTRQHAAQEKKKIQVQEVSADHFVCFVFPSFEVWYNVSVDFYVSA